MIVKWPKKLNNRNNNIQHKLVARDLHIRRKHELKADECLVWILKSSHEIVKQHLCIEINIMPIHATIFVTTQQVVNLFYTTLSQHSRNGQ